jgi:hypothetical protein
MEIPKMDKLTLNIQDTDDQKIKEIVFGVCKLLDEAGVTANGGYRVDVDPDTGEHREVIHILNNYPAKLTDDSWSLWRP